MWPRLVECRLSIDGGAFVPLYGSDTTLARVNDFLIDIYPVTNAQYLEFVKAKPEWKKSKVKGLFADENYLLQWESL